MVVGDGASRRSAWAEAVDYGRHARAIATSDRPLTERLGRAATLMALLAFADDPEEALALSWPWIGPLVREAFAEC